MLGLQAATYYPVTVNYDPEYGTGESPVADFPVLLRIPASSPIYANAGNNGENLRFTNAQNVDIIYPHEIDTWNPSGESLVWVKLPELTKDLIFRLYCVSGNDAEEAMVVPAAKDVWSGYAGVWHLNEAKDSAEKDLNPAGTEHTTRIYGTEIPLDSQSPAVIGKGYGQSAAGKGPTFTSQVYDNRNGYKCPIQVSSPSSFTVSCWVRVNDSATAWNLLFAPLAAQNGNTTWRADFSKASAAEIRVAQHGGDGNALKSFAVTGLLNAWSKIDVVWNIKNVELYVNGSLVGTATFSMEPQWGWWQWMGWGGYVDGNTGDAVLNNSIGADFDECRIFDGVASAKRIAADYATVNDPSFLEIGNETEEQDIPPGTVAQVNGHYYQDFAAAVAAARTNGDPVVLKANGQSWTFTTEGESLDIVLGGSEFEAINGLSESNYYIEVTKNKDTGVTTYQLLKQIKVAAMRNVAIWKELYTRDLADLLPEQVAGLAADGSIIGMFDVVWSVNDITAYDRFGVTPVPGVVTVGGETMPVTAFVRATLSYSEGYHNIAPEAVSMHAVVPAVGDYPGETDELKISNKQDTSVLTNGLPAVADVAAGWPSDVTNPYVNWGTRASNPYLDVDFAWSEPKNVYRVEIYCTGGNNNTPPESIEFSAGGETLSYNSVKQNSNDRPKVNSRINMCYDFSTPVSISDLKIGFKQPTSLADRACVNLLEILVWSDGGPIDVAEPSTSADLQQLEIDGEPVALEPGRTSYVIQGANEVTLAKGAVNVAVTVLPEENNLIRIVTMAEDGSSKTYKIRTSAGYALYFR